MPMASTLCIATQFVGLKNKLDDYLSHSTIPPRQVTDPPYGNYKFLPPLRNLIEFRCHSFSSLCFCHRSYLGPSSLSSGARKFTLGSRGRQLELYGTFHFRGLLSKCEATEFDSVPQENGGEGVAMATLVWRAIKLPIYSVALVPIMVGIQIYGILNQLAVLWFYINFLRNEARLFLCLLFIPYY